MRSLSLALGVLLCGCSMNGAVSTKSESGAEQTTSIDLKRASLWVSDLDRAIEFYEYVLGYRLSSVGELNPKNDFVLIDLFNVSPDVKIKRALFSTELEERVLFVMAAEGAPSYKAGEARHSSMVLRTNDLDSLLARATEKGFAIGASETDIVSGTDTKFKEAVIEGPDGHAVLVYQILSADTPE